MLGGNRGKYLLLAVGAALFAGYAVTVTRREEKVVDQVEPSDPAVAADVEYLLEKKAHVETIRTLQTTYPKALQLLAATYRALDRDDAFNRERILQNRLTRMTLVSIVGDHGAFLNAQIESNALLESDLIRLFVDDINYAMSLFSEDDDQPWKEALLLPGVDFVKIIQLVKSDKALFKALIDNGLNEKISTALSPTARPATNGATVGLFAKTAIPADIALMIGENIGAAEASTLRLVNRSANHEADAEIAFNAALRP